MIFDIDSSQNNTQIYVCNEFRSHLKEKIVPQAFWGNEQSIIRIGFSLQHTPKIIIWWGNILPIDSLRFFGVTFAFSTKCFTIARIFFSFKVSYFLIMAGGSRCSRLGLYIALSILTNKSCKKSSYMGRLGDQKLLFEQ